jgi:predicted dehydrogenase
VHFLIEKPIALTLAQANEMRAQVRASGVKTQVGFKYRHGAVAEFLKRYLRHTNVDGSAFLSMHYACNSLHRRWWRERSKSGGQTVEQIIHLFDLARFLLGEAVQVFSMQDNLFHRQLPDYTIEDASATTIRFRSGAIANVVATNGAIPNRWEYGWRLVLPGLTADASDANHAVLHHTDRAPSPTTRIADDKDLFLAQTLDLFAAIREERETLAPIEEGVRSLELALAAARSAELAMPVGL